MRYSCVVFDFDGTIADTMETARLIYNKIAKSSGFNIVNSEDVAGLQLLKTNEIINHLGIAKIKIPGLVRKGRNLFNAEIKNISLFPEMKNCLQKIRNETDTLGILSTNSSENIAEFLRLNDLPNFDFIQSTTRLKSKRARLKSILKQYKIPSKNLIYIGDESTDIEAAHQNSSDSIAVTWGYHSPTVLQNIAPTHLVDTPEQILDIICS